MMIFVHAIGFGLVTASILALASVGLTLQFGVTNYINFAYGELLTFGAYFAWIANQHGWNIWLALVVAAIGCGVVGVLLNVLVLRNFVRKNYPLLFMLVVTFALSLILSNVIVAIWGGNFQQYAGTASSPLNIGPFLFTGQQLVIILIALLVMGGIHVLLTYTKLGKAMRAMSDNPTLAQNCGINTGAVTNFTWFLSGLLGGIAGVVLAINLGSFQAGSGADFLFVIFAAVILGGIGKPYGAMAGALVIGLATELGAALPFISSDYKNDIAFAILVVVLLVRPQGIFTSEGKA